MKMKSIKHWSEDDRPREKLILHGPSKLSHAELLAILIQSGHAEVSALDLAKQILHSVDNNLLELSSKDVHYFSKQFKGIGNAKAVAIVAALELGRRRHGSAVLGRTKITDSNSAFKIFFNDLCDLSHEEFWVLLINTTGNIIAKKRINEGGTCRTMVDIKKLMKSAVEVNAVAMVLAHNHPSGSLSPSQEDILLTQRIIESGRLLDIQILDHLILKGNLYYSFSDEGLL